MRGGAVEVNSATGAGRASVVDAEVCPLGGFHDTLEAVGVDVDEVAVVAGLEADLVDPGERGVDHGLDAVGAAGDRQRADGAVVEPGLQAFFRREGEAPVERAVQELDVDVVGAAQDREDRAGLDRKSVV